jgi:hypothetical protein
LAPPSHSRTLTQRLAMAVKSHEFYKFSSPYHLVQFAPMSISMPPRL